MSNKKWSATVAVYLDADTWIKARDIAEQHKVTVAQLFANYIEKAASNRDYRTSNKKSGDQDKARSPD